MKPEAKIDQRLVELERETRALDDQLKRLVKTESRLYRTQRQLDAQIRRVNALNQLALEAGRAGDPTEILTLAGDALMAMFPFEQVVGLWCETSTRARPVVARAAPGREACAHGWPEELALDAVEPSSFWEPLLHHDRAGALRPRTLEPLARACETIFPSGPADSERSVAYLVLPLFGRSHTLRALLLARRITPEVTYHAPLPNAQDQPFLQLFSRHVESAIENALLLRDLLGAAAELEERVRARTAELRETQAELVIAGKMAAIGTLAAGLSHELNNPIGVILGATQLLLEKAEPDSEARRPLAVIERQARRSAQLVGALLDFSRKRDPVREPIEAAALIERIDRLASGHPRRQKVRLTIVIADRLPTLSVCVTEIESALLNLIANAFDASAGGGEVEVRVDPAEREGRAGVRFAVLDRGAGIPDELLPRIFDPFFTTKAVGQGTGLGLSLARQIALAHEGALEVETRVGSGTRFSIWLPAHEAERNGTESTE